MTPKEKAKDLLNKLGLPPLAIVCAEEIWKGIDENFHAHPDSPHLSEIHWNKVKEYWEQVKIEIGE